MKIQSNPVLLSALLLLISFFSINCATLFSKTRYQLHVNTDPRGVTIHVTDRKGREVFHGRSPTTITLRSGAGFFTPAKYYVKLTMDGYKEKTVPVTFTIDGWYFGNIIIGGALGMLVIDPATGAMWKIKDPVVDETMEPVAATTMSTLKILDIHDIPDSLKKNLVKISL